MRYRFIRQHKKTWPIRLMCSVLSVSRSGYYDWCNRRPGPRELYNKKLDRAIEVSFADNDQCYGSPRITVDLKEQGYQCSENRVARRMKVLELKAVQSARFKVTTDSNHNKPVAQDLINQDFSADLPNRKWVSDITYLWTDEGWLYLAVVMDLYSRAIIGWSMNRRMTRALVIDALTMALNRRGFPHGTIIHSDRGSQYCSSDYQKLIKSHGLTCSMGRRANCYDNAAMESFFHTLKVERVHRHRYRTRREATTSVFEYIEAYYNRRRRHSAIGLMAPMHFEQIRLSA